MERNRLPGVRFALAGLIMALSANLTIAQPSTPTTGALNSTFMAQFGNERATIFTIDVDNREYWITAKHLLTGAQHPPYGSYSQPKVTLDILNPGLDGQKWLTTEFSVIDTGKDVDIAVLAAPHPLMAASQNLLFGSEHVTLGGDCTFLGFPYGGGWRAKWDTGASVWYPYIKRCSLSARLEDNIWVLDGINNAGFSGGPVLFNTGPQQRIFAVISGYHTEPAEVLPAPPPLPQPTAKATTGTLKKGQEKEKTKEGKQIVNVNSGFIIAYDIQFAIDAIHKNPIGPLRSP